MPLMVDDPSTWSTLIIRVWVDEGGGFRARLTEVHDVDSPGRAVAAAHNFDGVLSATHAWLTGLAVPSQGADKAQPGPGP